MLLRSHAEATSGDTKAGVLAALEAGDGGARGIGGYDFGVVDVVIVRVVSMVVVVVVVGIVISKVVNDQIHNVSQRSWWDSVYTHRLTETAIQCLKLYFILKILIGKYVKLLVRMPWVYILMG